MIVSSFTLHYVCFSCRRSIKSVVRQPQIPCSLCDEEMICLGRDFAAPRKNDDAQWKKLGWMLANGWRPSRYAAQPSQSTRPEFTLRQTQELVVANAQAKLKADHKAKEDAALYERRRAAKYGYSRPKIGNKRRKNRAKQEWKRQEEYQLRALAEAQSRLESE